MMLTFKPIITTYWESEDGRFHIETAYSRGFCVRDLDHYDDALDDYKQTFVATLEEAMAWCQSRTPTP